MAALASGKLVAKGSASRPGGRLQAHPPELAPGPQRGCLHPRTFQGDRGDKPSTPRTHSYRPLPTQAPASRETRVISPGAHGVGDDQVWVTKVVIRHPT